MELAGPSRATGSLSPPPEDIPLISFEETPGHVLFNSVIICTILDHCPSSSWAAFRLQCKAWNDAALHRFRDLFPVHLHSLVYSRKESIAEQNCFTTLYDMVHAPGDPFLFNKHQFDQLILHPGVTLDVGIIQGNFFTRVGPWLKVLYLHKVTLTPKCFASLIFKHTPNLEDLIYQECKIKEGVAPHLKKVKNLKGSLYQLQPNMKSIHICMQTTDSRRSSPFPISWTNFLLHFPNLKTLRLEGFPDSSAPATFQTIINAISSIREANDNQVLNLTTFDIRKFIFVEDSQKVVLLLLNLSMSQPAAVTPKTIPNLVDICSSLRTLTLYINALNGEQLSLVLEACFNLVNLQLEQQQTLKSFENFRYATIPRTLQKLDLYGPIFRTWEFLAFTPKLTQLKIQMTSEAATIEYPDVRLDTRIAPLEHLTSFQLFTEYPIFLINPVGCTMFFGKVMPNLKKVRIPLNMNALANLCEYWPQLEELEMTKHFLMHTHVVVARLSELKNLKVLKLIDDDHDNYFEGHHIRDLFLKMPVLESLTANLHQDDIEALRLLKARIENTDGCVVKIPAGLYCEKECFANMPLSKYLEDIDSGMTAEEIQAACKATYKPVSVFDPLRARIQQRF